MSTVEDAFVAYRTTRDPAALAAVYDGTSSRLLAVALHLSGSASAAEDAVQDTFLFALEHPERWDATRPLVPWLLGILSNVLKQSAYRARRAPDPERLQVPEARDPESTLEANEVLSTIEQAITDLPQPYRTVVLLRLRNGLSPADIAVALDRKPSTVRAQLTRGVEMLRKVLPTGVAGLLVGTLATSRGLTAAREVVLGRAEVLHRATLAEHSAAMMRTWAARAVAMVCVALAAWGISGLFGAEPDAPEPVVTTPLAEAPPVAAVADSAQAELLQFDDKTQVSRMPVAQTGSLTVRVRRNGVAMPAALVELEPLENPPHAIVHRTSTSRGNWERIEALRPFPSERHERRFTEGDGRCRFAELAAGFWICRVLGIEQVVRVAPGATADAVVAVEPASRLVRGLVMDAMGRAVADAPVWICREHRARSRRVVLRTDASGRFVLAVAPHTTIGALHDGYAPIATMVGRTATMPPLDLVLQFHERGAGLFGVVRDEAGEAVAGAEVEVGHPSDSRIQTAPGASAILARPARVITDADGRFRVGCLVPGQTRVAVHGRGYGVASRVLTLRTDEKNEVALTLPRGGSVVGVVRTAAGDPMVGVSVRIGRPGSLNFRSTATDQRGTYRLDGVPAGEALLEFNDYRGGFASHLTAVAAGQTSQQDAVMDPADLLLHGQVLAESELPLARGWIQFCHEGKRHAYQLDPYGRFSIRVSDRYAALPARILVFADDPRRIKARDLPAPIASARDLRPGGGEIVIRVGEEPDHTCWLHGTMRLADAKLPSDAVLVRRIGEVGWRRYRCVVDANGQFRVGPMPPGRYLVRHVDQSGAFGPFVADGPQVEIGELQLRASQLESDRQLHNRQVALLYPPGVTEAQWAFLEIRDGDGRIVVTKTHPGSLSDLSECYVSLPEGQFTMRVQTQQGLVGQAELRVAAGSSPRRAVMVDLRRP